MYKNVFFCVAYSISRVAYYPARVGNVLGSEHIYEGGLPLPSPPVVFILGQAGFEPTTPGVCESNALTTRPRRLLTKMQKLKIFK